MLKVEFDISENEEETFILDFEREFKEESKSSEEEEETKTKSVFIDDYDTNDPFIDDQEDNSNQNQRPEIDGYFVWKGEIPLVEMQSDDDFDL